MHQGAGSPQARLFSDQRFTYIKQPNIPELHRLALLRTLGLNLLRTNGFRSIRAGLMAVAHDINRTLGWSGIQALKRD
jgi:hypothetical protein